MNENIGVKGGKRDRRRTLIITEEKKKKLKEYNKKLKEESLENLEKEVKRNQIITFFKAMPIILAGKSFEVITNTLTDEKNNNKKDSTIEDKNSKIEMLDSNSEIIVSSNKEKNIKENIIIHNGLLLTNAKIPVSIKENFETVILEKNNIEKIETKLDTNNKKSITTYEIKNNESLAEEVINSSRDDVSKKEVSAIVNIPNSLIDKGIDEDYLELQNVKNKEILNEYEKELKDIRYDLKNLVFEYNAIDEEENKLYKKDEAIELLDKLNVVIRKIEELKEKIKINQFDSYDKNYLESLVDEYIREFRDKKIISEIKDSSLYILISEKLDELDKEKDKLYEKVNKRKEKLDIDNKNLLELKERYYDFENINKNLLEIQKSQEKALRDLEEKIKNSTTVVEKVTYEIQALNDQSNLLLKKASLFSLIPGVRSSKIMATMAAYFMYFTKRVNKPKLSKKVYKKLEVKDYASEIENSMDMIDNASSTLYNTTKKLESMIYSFKDKYREYFSVMPEVQTLLNNLYSVLDNLKEKEYELNKIKLKQQQLLVKNNEKVKKIENSN